MIGFVLVDKPVGPTSHDVVDVVRRALGIKRVGHAGTLDPPASGLLVVAVGPATRLLRYVQGLDKTYEATGVLGVRTTTLDAAGDVVSEEPADVDEARLRSALDAFVGEIDQVPPAVSAVKVAGERAYKRAARGEDVVIEPRRVRVYDLALVAYDPPRFEIVLRCSSGTYVRSLVADVGDALGCGAHTASLRRTAIGHLLVSDAVAPGTVEADAVMAVEDVLSQFQRVEVDAEVAHRAGNGQQIEAAARDGEVLVVGPGGTVGVFESRDGMLRPVTVLGSRS